MAYKGIIFELEGTVVDTRPQHYKAWAVIANRVGIPFNPALHRQMQGPSGMEELEVLLQNYRGRPFTYEEKDGLAEEQNAIYQRALSALTPADLTSEAAEVLERLKVKGFPLAACQFGHGLLWGPKNLGLGGVFDTMINGGPLATPTAEAFLLAARELDLPASACLVVAGTSLGVSSAKSAGFATAGVGAETFSAHPLYPLPSLAKLSGLMDTMAPKDQRGPVTNTSSF